MPSLTCRVRVALVAGGLALSLQPVRAALGPCYGGDLRLALWELPTSLDPTRAANGSNGWTTLVHEPLVLWQGGRVVPNLVSSWSSSASDHEWTLDLPADLVFHDGSAITGDAAVRALRAFVRTPSAAARVFAEELEGGISFRDHRSEELAAVTAPDPHHLMLRFSAPYAHPLAPLAAPGAAIVSPRGAGAGPFIPSSFVPGRRVGLTSFRFHHRGRPFLDRIDLTRVADGGSEPDLVPRIDGALTRRAGVLLLALNSTRPPFDRAEQRTALASRIDRDDLVRRFWPGATPGWELWRPHALPDHAAASASRDGRSFKLAVGMDVPRDVSQRVVAWMISLGLAPHAEPLSPTEARSARAAARLIVWTPEVAEPGLALRELSMMADDGRSAEAADLSRIQDVPIPLAEVPIAFHARAGLHGGRLDEEGRLVLEDAWLEP